MNAFFHFFQRHQSRLWTYSLVLVWTFFLAKTTNDMVAYFLLPYELPEISQKSRGVDRTSPDLSIRTILSRNLFNSSAQSDIPTIPQVTDSQEIVPSSLPLELLGTIVFQNSKYSVALVSERQGRSASYYGIGEKIMGATIVKVERFSLIVENKGRLERLEIQAAKSSLSAQPSRTTPRPISQPTNENVEFTEIGPGRFEVPQTYVDGVLKNFSSILTQARMVPNIVDGNKTDGFKIFQIKRDSIFEKLGLKNNDVIKQVNGVALDSFEKATGLYTALRNEKSISIDVVRDGTRLNYTYEIR